MKNAFSKRRFGGLPHGYFPMSYPADRTWFVSDLHFCHRGIIDHCRRPFADLDVMHRGLIDAWNESVALTDFAFVVGDFSLGSRKRAPQVMSQLNGQKFLVRGNHDDGCRGLFEWCKDLYTVKVQDPDAPCADPKGLQRIVLCHYALKVWDRRHFGVWQLYGHSHGNLADDPSSLAIDVGVDENARRGFGYRPISYAEVKALMMAKPCWPISGKVDHHEPSRA